MPLSSGEEFDGQCKCCVSLWVTRFWAVIVGFVVGHFMFQCTGALMVLRCDDRGVGDDSGGDAGGGGWVHDLHLT